MKHIAKARTHSGCGHPLDLVTMCEVIPAEQYCFQQKMYEETALPDNLPDLTTEYRCSYCHSPLHGADLDYVTKRLKNGKEVSKTNQGSLQIYQAKNEDARHQSDHA